jgi:hypothetical protein
LLGLTGSRDVVDAVVAGMAAELRADVVTGDRADIRMKPVFQHLPGS